MSESLFNESVVVCQECDGSGGTIIMPSTESFSISDRLWLWPTWRPCECCHGNGYVLRKDESA